MATVSEISTSTPSPPAMVTRRTCFKKYSFYSVSTGPNTEIVRPAPEPTKTTKASTKPTKRSFLKRFSFSSTSRVVTTEAEAETTATPTGPAATPARRWFKKMRSWSSVSLRSWKPSFSFGRLLALSRSLRWKRLSISFSVLDAVYFRIVYVLEAVVLGLALSCFFLCCGCHI